METIITKHIVRPSIPTPHKFKTHKLSSIDQLMPSYYVPLIFFYDNDQSRPYKEIAQRLRQSLSETLTVFYPLAGRINGNLFVDCDDSGVEMVEARVQAPLSKFTQNPKMEELIPLIPTNATSREDIDPIMLVKVNSFDCGGIAIGVSWSHKVADAASYVSFVNAWAAMCRGEGSRIIRPSFDLAVHFPPMDDLPTLDIMRPEGEKFTAKRFVFNREKLEKLRKEAKDSTKVEAVSGFIWKSFIEAYSPTETTSFASIHVVNLRPRVVPPSPEHAFGNCAIPSVPAIISSQDDDCTNMGALVSKLSASIKRMDNDFINNVIKDEKTIKDSGLILNSSKCCPFTSWRFPVYEADFGWGKPVWVCCGVVHSTNIVILMDTPSRDGIEAWVSLPQDHHFFQIFQANYNNLLA